MSDKPYVNKNILLPEASRQVGDMVLGALENNPTFMSAALPSKIFPPLFNCFQNGYGFGAYVDNAVRYVKVTPVQIRTALSMTLFFSDSEKYEGSEWLLNILILTIK